MKIETIANVIFFIVINNIEDKESKLYSNIMDLICAYLSNNEMLNEESLALVHGEGEREFFNEHSINKKLLTENISKLENYPTKERGMLKIHLEGIKNNLIEYENDIPIDIFECLFSFVESIITILNVELKVVEIGLN